jgi:hypothetical protein
MRASFIENTLFICAVDVNGPRRLSRETIVCLEKVDVGTTATFIAA